jgi:hypothetical protein
MDIGGLGQAKHLPPHPLIEKELKLNKSKYARCEYLKLKYLF